MKTKVKCGIVAFVVGCSIVVLLTSLRSSNLDQLYLNDVEAISSDESLSDWWERKDWVCDEVQCLPGLKATFPRKVDPGTGTSAHSWDCTTCSDILGDDTHYYSYR